MIKKIIIFFYFNLVICDQALLDNIFNYSFNNIQTQTSSYNFKIIKSQYNNLNYHITWSPTSNLLINTNFINQFSKDNKIYYNINSGLVLSNKMYSNIIGIGIHFLKFDQEFNNVKWNNFFSNTELNFDNWFNVNLELSYYYNGTISFLDLGMYINKIFYKNLNIGVGGNFSIKPIMHKIYLGINYSL